MEKLNFEVGKRYTIFRIGEALAMTSKTELEVVEVREKDFIFKMRGKRKTYVFPLISRHYESAPEEHFKGAVFQGWDQPITCDTDQEGRDNGRGLICRTMRGNACYNFIGEPEAIRDWIDKAQLNPYFDKVAVLAITSDKEEGERVVYPELFKGGHAVIERILEKTAQLIKVKMAEGDPRVCDYCNKDLVNGEGEVIEPAHLTDYGLMCDKCLGDIKPLASYKPGDNVSKERWHAGAMV